ncbi:MAG TPA: hypothetical protein VMB50_05045 [Myxococcales bacterium]|nr:hypothetical protein [Myxococcales bacterium]
MKRAAINAFALALAAGCARAPGAAPDALTAPAGRVTFELRSAPTSGLPPTFAVTACFWSGGETPTLDGGSPTPCRGSVVSGCCLSDVDPGIDRQGCTDENVDVGPVQLLANGAVIGTASLTSGNYALSPGGSPSWKAGDRLEVRGGGTNGFPAFDVSVVAAAAPALSQPTVGAGTALAFARTQPLLFSWSPAATASSAETWISATEPQSGDLESADCFAPGNPGQASFPAGMLSNLPAGLGTAEVALENDAMAGPVEIVSRGETELAVQTQ